MWIEVSRKYLSFCVPMSAILSASYTVVEQLFLSENILLHLFP